MTCASLFLISALFSQMVADTVMQTTASINQSGQNHQGVLMFNQAASDGQQVNARALAAGCGTNAQAAAIITCSASKTTNNPAGIDASASIGGNSFANNQGVVGVNQRRGSGNNGVMQ
jgi:hypothetical protein